ncbi:MAG: hypothetical protein E7168_05470 [Firmicutes bacterium]|nr:hypothetical protein [Bacillota bacterium]
MYTEENEKRGFPLRDFLLKLLLVIIFVLLLVWLLPKVIIPKLPESNQLSALTSQIFADNLDRMKDAAQSYYTNERLPQIIGEKDTMTLREMIAEKLVVPFVDKNGKACDVDKSYVSIEKLEDEYLMKVFLSCSEEEDYILVHMGCYDYCDSDLCQKKEEEVVVTQTKPEPVTPKPIPDTPNDPTNPEPEPVLEYLYEYKKAETKTLSKWGEWSNWIRYVDADGIQAITCNENDFSCLRQVKVKTQREKVGTYQKAYVQERTIQEEVGRYTEYWCEEYAYVKYGDTVYATTGGEFVSQGIDLYTTAPNDTATTYYVFRGVSWEGCDETCQTLPKFKYEKYVYTGTMVETTGNENYTVSCAVKGEREVTVYANKTIAQKAYREEPAYADIKYYSEQLRTIITTGNAETKWSSSANDQSLINQGFYYTGNKKQK